MPVENVALKVNWSTDKLIESVVEKPRVGVYNANIDQSEPFRFKNKIKSVAVIGAGPAGVSLDCVYPCTETHLDTNSCLLPNCFLMRGFKSKFMKETQHREELGMFISHCTELSCI